MKIFEPEQLLYENVIIDQEINKKKAESCYEDSASIEVVPPGIEPGTQGFSVLCSTN